MRSSRAALMLLCAAFAGNAVAHEASQGGVTVAHPWVRATPGGATTGAAYLEIKVADGVTDRLVSASSPAAGRAEIHTHTMDGDVMRMRRVDGLDVKSGSVVLKPQGNHVMLMDLKGPLKEGDLVNLKLVFEKAGAIDVEATVEPIGANGPHGMDSQPVDAPADGGGHDGHDHHH
jgi:periplasmic copper chaperone A